MVFKDLDQSFRQRGPDFRVTWREGAALVNNVDYWVAASHWALGSKKSLSLRKRYTNSRSQIQWKLNPWEYVLQVPV